MRIFCDGEVVETLQQTRSPTKIWLTLHPSNCQGEPQLSSLLPSRRDKDASAAPTLQRDDQQIWTGISDGQEAETTGLSTLCQTFGHSQTQTCRKERGAVM